MRRRAVLVTAGMVSTMGMSGCATFLNDRPPARPWPESNVVEDSEGTHDLFVENHTETSEIAWLRVIRSDDRVLVDGRYELPNGRAIRFEDLAGWECTYTIDIAIDGGARTSFEWIVEACGPGAEAPGDTGSRNAAVRVEPPTGWNGEQLRFVVDQCDAIVAGAIPAGSAAYFRLDE